MSRINSKWPMEGMLSPEPAEAVQPTMMHQSNISTSLAMLLLFVGKYDLRNSIDASF
jgi:hypothetical protein